MELSELQQEFKSYLKSLNNSSGSGSSSGKYKLEDKNVSLFSYADEFDNFLNEKYKDSAKDAIIAKSELLNLTFKDGKFDEENIDLDNDNLPLIGILNDLLTDEKVKNIIDSDGNKEISNEEIKGFLDAIDSLDGSEDNISLEDILWGTKAINKIKDLDINKLNSIAKQEKNKNATNPINANIPNVKSAGSIGGSYGNYGGFGEYNSSGSLGGVPSNIQQGDTIEELTRQKTEKEDELHKAQEAYNQVYSGGNANVNAAQDNYETARDTYEKLLEDEKNLTDEQKKQLEEAENTVADITKSVDSAQVKLKEAENAVTEQESTVSADENNLSALKSSLSSLKSQTSEDNEVQAEINAKIFGLNSQISSAESKLETDKTKLEELKTKKTEAEKELTDKKTELEQAKENKTKLEQEFIVNNENISKELKEALQKCNETQQNVETVKDSEAVKAQNSIDKIQGELDKISNKINEKQTQKVQQESQVSTGDIAKLKSFGRNHQYDDFIAEAAKTYNIDILLLRSLIEQESGCNQNARSYCGAIGVMQLMPETAAGLGVDPYDARQNILGGAKYLRQQLDTFGGNVSSALAAYNAGPGAVQQYGGIPPYAETQNYVASILSIYDGIK